ncbi:hypothetical protein [Burkholderia sp. Cy-637]|uniref:McrC family protein n=1 Tax=Burkholderia sp. Cy-637 TaxID=2608327 RepID=UPI00141E76DB|nr:hypothetical protein [Burkholderia sp. Cy-637]NIF89421.1 hypothetical protein [Burkholderia sp. Cy-637]
MSAPPLVAFERETIRIAPDAEVAELRRLAQLSAAGLASEVNAGFDVSGGRDGFGRLVVTQAEATALELLNVTREGFCSRTAGGLALSKYCGIVRIGSVSRAGSLADGLAMEILPKVWGVDVEPGAESAGTRAASIGAARRALLRMLAFANGLPISELDMAPQSVADVTLLDLFVRSFLREALRVAKGGLLTRYVEAIDDLNALRGRILLAETERLIATRPGLYRCAHDELIIDNPYNQVLLAAIEICRSRILKASTARLWGEARAFFSGVSFVRMRAHQVAALKRGRETVRYGEALRWAELLLGLLSPSLAAGTSDAPALLFNMEALFERWVERHERGNAPEGVLVRFKGVSRDLARVEHDRVVAGTLVSSSGRTRSAFRLMPDVLLWCEGEDLDTGSPTAIVDAKWKVLDPRRRDWGVDENDAHQILAYLTRYGCRVARLAYPVLKVAVPAEGPPTFKIDLPGGDVATIGVELVPIDA